MSTVKTVPANDKNVAISTIMAAFRSDPVAQWFWPDTQQYLEVFPSFVKAFAGAAFAHNSAYCTDDYSGVALWLPPGIHPDEKALGAIIEDTISEPRQASIGALLEQMGLKHPIEPHWYLPMIGVIPGQQGRGYGSALLLHALERCDLDGVLAYLEASSSKSVPLYERRGFDVVGTIQVGSSPPLFAMLRKPRRFALSAVKESPAAQSLNSSNVLA